MNVKNVDKKENSTVQLVLEIEKDQFQDALNKAYRKNKNSIFVPGFRKGKAPRKIIEGMYGESVFYEDAINILFPEVYQEAVKSQDIKNVGQPSIDDMNVGDDGILTLTVTTAVYPEVTLGQYKDLEAEKPVVEVIDQDIDDEIESLLKRNSRLVSVEREIRDGDTAIIDFEGFDNGEPFEGGKGEKHNLVIGSGSFVPGFEEQIIGLKAGDSKDVELTFPEDYVEHLAGKDVVFKCYVHEVKENVKPELDNEFAKDVSEHDTVEELKNSIRERLTNERQASADNTFENNVISKIVEGLQAEIPEVMIEEQLDKIIQNFNYQLQMNGIPFDEYLRMMGTDILTFRNNYRQMALRQVQSDLALNKIAEVEDIQISEEEIEAEYDRLAENYSTEKEQLKAMIVQDDLIGDLKAVKALNLVKESATAVEPKPEPEAGQAGEENEAGEKKAPAKKRTSKKKEEKDGE